MIKRWQIIVAVALALAGAAVYAGTEVDQGKPGTYGAWPFYAKATTASTSSPTATTTSLTGNATACTAAGGASCTIVYASTNWLSYSNLTIYIRNSGANTIENVLVEISPDNTNFKILDSTTFASLAASSMAYLSIAGNSYKYIRIEARASANSSAVVNITANTL